MDSLSAMDQSLPNTVNLLDTAITDGPLSTSIPQHQTFVLLQRRTTTPTGQIITQTMIEERGPPGAPSQEPDGNYNHSPSFSADQGRKRQKRFAEPVCPGAPRKPCRYHQKSRIFCGNDCKKRLMRFVPSAEGFSDDSDVEADRQQPGEDQNAQQDWKQEPEAGLSEHLRERKARTRALEIRTRANWHRDDSDTMTLDIRPKPKSHGVDPATTTLDIRTRPLRHNNNDQR